MGLECFLSGSLISSDVEFPTEATNAQLFKESRDAASDLQMADHEFSVADYLLSLRKIGHISLIVNAPRKITSALFFIRASRYDSVYNRLVGSHFGRELFNVALDDGFTPFGHIYLFIEAHKVLVENKLGIEFALFGSFFVHDIKVISRI